jgi:hypothetical protein
VRCTPPAAELFAALRRIRAQQYALVATDRPLRRTVAVVIDGVHAAVGLSGDFPDARVPDLVAALNDATRRISAAHRIGGS